MAKCNDAPPDQACDPYQDATKHPSGTWYQVYVALYFSSFFHLCHCFMFNVLGALVIDAYDAQKADTGMRRTQTIRKVLMPQMRAGEDYETAQLLAYWKVYQKECRKKDWHTLGLS